MSTTTQLAPRGEAIDIHGSCLAHQSTLRAGFARLDWKRLVALPGNYCLTTRTALVACAVGPPNLFYTSVNGRLVHAQSVVDVVRLAGLPWRWNWRALADVTALEHCIDGDTLHADVRKLRAGEVVRSDGTNLHSWQMPWAERMACADASPEAALDALIDACRGCIGHDVVVSMSAGFDSRLLLACLLEAGMKPRLITMGNRDSTDARVSEAIARRFGLDLNLVSLDPEGYLSNAGAIARITSGSKTFQNWHTYLYAKNADLTPSSQLFIGSNGEAARSYYLDKGFAAVVADRLASERTKQAFWRTKSRSVLHDDEVALLHPDFAREFSAQGSSARLNRLLQLSPGPLLSGLDHFYTDHRVTNFISNGLSLVAAHATPAVPMLDARWTAQVWNLPRHWKMDSKWHRFAIAKACPELLEFEEEKRGAPMRATSRRLYWLPNRRRRVSKPYVDYAQLLRSEMILQTISDKRRDIEPVARPSLLRLIFARHAAGVNRVRAASFLLTMLHFVECLREDPRLSWA